MEIYESQSEMGFHKEGGMVSAACRVRSINPGGSELEQAATTCPFDEAQLPKAGPEMENDRPRVSEPNTELL